MSIIRRILGNGESRNLGGLGLVPQAFDRAPFLSSSKVSPASTLGLASAWSAITLISDVLSTLPIDAYVRDNGQRRPYRPGGSKPAWLLVPSPRQPALGINSIISQICVSLYLNGNAFVYAPKDPDSAEPLEVVVLDGNDQPGRLVRVRLAVGSQLPAAVHAKVTESVVVSERLVLDGGGGALAVARRGSDDDRIRWSIVFDAGLDPTDPALRAQADQALARLRDSLGV